MKILGYTAVALFVIAIISSIIILFNTLTRKEGKKSIIAAIASYLGIILIMLISSGKNTGKVADGSVSDQGVSSSTHNSNNSSTTSAPVLRSDTDYLDSLEKTEAFVNDNDNIGKTVQFTAWINGVVDNSYSLCMESGKSVIGNGLITGVNAETDDKVLFTGSFKGISESYVSEFDTMDLQILEKAKKPEAQTTNTKQEVTGPDVENGIKLLRTIFPEKDGWTITPSNKTSMNKYFFCSPVGTAASDYFTYQNPPADAFDPIDIVVYDIFGDETYYTTGNILAMVASNGRILLSGSIWYNYYSYCVDYDMTRVL